MRILKKTAVCLLAVVMLAVCMPIASLADGKTVTLTVGQSITEVLSEDVAENIDFSTLDTDIANASVDTVEVPSETNWQYVSDGAAGVENGKRYIISSTMASGTGYALTNAADRATLYITDGTITSPDSFAIFTFEQNGTGYNLRDENGTYLGIGGTWNYSITTGNTTPMPFTVSGSSAVALSATASNRTLYIRYSYNRFSAATNSSSLLYLFEETVTSFAPQTELSIVGKSVGSTSFTVGDTVYTVNVVEEDLISAPSLNLEYWVGNTPVLAESATSRKLTADMAYGEQGIELSGLAPAFGKRNADSGEQATVYWKSSLFGSAGSQNTSADNSMSGTEVKYIRYYGSTWSVSADRAEWININSSSYQLVAYYLMHIPLTDDVYPAAKDWGFKNGEGWGYNDSGDRCFLSFRVIYEDGTSYPSDEALTDTTYVYWLGGERYVGYVALIPGIADTEVYKVSYTMGNAQYSLNSSDYATYINSFDFSSANETVLCENYDGFKEAVLIDCSSATAPYNDIKWNSSYNACVFNVYVKNKVHYHSYSSVTTNPTCTDEGYTVFTCECGDSYTETIPANGHSYILETFEPTCTEKGYALHTCSVCAESFTDSVVEALGHSYVSEIVLPTAERQGYTLHTCETCSDSFKDNYTDWSTFFRARFSGTVAGKCKKALVTLSFVNFQSFSSAYLELLYDETLSLDSVYCSNEAVGVEIYNNILMLSGEITADDELTLEFTVLPEAADGEHTVGIDLENSILKDADGNSILFVSENGVIIVEPHTAGDITGDGKTNSADLIRLRKYLADREGVTVSLPACDVNNDGIINNKDLVHLMRYFSGEGIEIY